MGAVLGHDAGELRQFRRTGDRTYRALGEKPTTNPDKAVLAMVLAAHAVDLSRE
ncbi:hypothetical protein [Arthrobacter sp. B0490]|uniref:hypothetical protein n=1 Tax=Arthrobacter sp. B0490 TaxID=2058891 RepID=UPI0015E3E3F3|nr:hypothetical protein [Arthrobacter sp. B0490]